MNQNGDALIKELEPIIEEKCFRLQRARAEKRKAVGFVLLCAAVIIIPTLLVFFGLSLTVLLIPVLFMTVSVLILSPILIQQQGEQNYEPVGTNPN